MKLTKTFYITIKHRQLRFDQQFAGSYFYVIYKKAENTVFLIFLCLWNIILRNIIWIKGLKKTM